MTSPAFTPVKRRATSSIIADLIRDRIVDGTLQPGAQLTEVQLARDLDVSRGPLREALQRLIQEGLLEGKPHKGVFVARMSRDDVADVYLARRAIERAALRVLTTSDNHASACEKLEALVNKMAEAASTTRWADVASLDREFHATLVASSRSKRLVRMYRTLLAETQMCISALEPAYPARDEIVKEHREVLEAIRVKEEDRALQSIDAHMDRAVADLSGRAPQA